MQGCYAYGQQYSHWENVASYYNARFRLKDPYKLKIEHHF